MVDKRKEGQAMLSNNQELMKTKKITVRKPSASALCGGCWSQISHFRYLAQNRGEYIPGCITTGL